MFNTRLLYMLILVLLLFAACTSQPSIQPTTTSPSQVPALGGVPASRVTATPLVPFTGQFEVNGRSLYIECLGNGSPTIVLEPGEGETHAAMNELQKTLASRTMTCAYDRAHTGGLRAAQDVVDDLHALLIAAKVPGPFVLVGSSAGGLFVQLYARKYPEQVVGVVAMNPVPPAHPWLDQVSKIFTEQEYADEEAYYHGKNGESFDYLSSSEQLTAAAAPPNIPFAMLLSTNVQCEGDDVCLKSYSSYEQILQEVTSTWPRGQFSQVAAGHEIYVSDMNAVVATVENILTSR